MTSMRTFYEAVYLRGAMKKNDSGDLKKWLNDDPLLRLYRSVILKRYDKRIQTVCSLCKKSQSLYDIAANHTWLGLHREEGHWVFREWAPNATQIFLIGTATKWKENKEFQLIRISPEGIWEIYLSEELLHHGDLFRLRIYWKNGCGDRIPAYATRVVQDPVTLIFNAQVWEPENPYLWKNDDFHISEAPLIYESHIGMAQDAEKIGSFKEFTENILPRVTAAGYNTLQLMAIQEHPYYGSFGYQISSFFAVSSRFGTPDEFKELVDMAHECGLRVIMDLIHSHAVVNEVEGISRFDGTLYQYFHNGARGFHPAWNSRCFNYRKHEVIKFLLSNCRYWLEEYHIDGFRFDGVTSMLYTHHGLGVSFTDYRQYFDDTVDEDALIYLSLANSLIHDIKPDAVTIAEDVSGMPGLAVSASAGGMGFDYRFAMGVPDYWIRLIKEYRDEDWPLGYLWFELINRRSDEKTISYAESHDQALVGDQTLIFRLIGSDMYDGMSIFSKENPKVNRGMALHCLIRFITITTAGSGYLNFMGNEFGHPEWIDFPREGNNWSYHYARRQWHLLDDPYLRYGLLAHFDRDMIAMIRKYRLLEFSDVLLLYEHYKDKIIVFERAGLVFMFNFHPVTSFVDYIMPMKSGKYRMIFNSDLSEYGGYDRLTPGQIHFTQHRAQSPASHVISVYLPSRTAQVLQFLDS
jgi:1,4-alpha-glucan branching enzyme